MNLGSLSEVMHFGMPNTLTTCYKKVLHSLGCSDALMYKYQDNLLGGSVLLS